MIAGILTYLDALLLAVVAISGLVAMYRGLTREVLSILSWVVAAVAAFYFTIRQRDLAVQLARQFASPEQNSHVIVAQVALGATTFLVVLIIVHLITSYVSDAVLDSRVGAIDRVLGLVFGVVRGFVLVVIPYMFVVSFVCKETTRALAQGCTQGELPGWVEQSRSLGLISSTSGTLYGFLSRYVPSALSGDQQQGFLRDVNPDPFAAPHGHPGQLGLYDTRPLRRGV
jgi:membrane protein required for colicin V production